MANKSWKRTSKYDYSMPYAKRKKAHRELIEARVKVLEAEDLMWTLATIAYDTGTLAIEDIVIATGASRSTFFAKRRVQMQLDL